MQRPKPLVLTILDGWGLETGLEGNAIALARTPNIDSYQSRYPYTSLECSGEVVGLPEGQMGNSEVGHLNIGSGRIVYQDLTKINVAIRDGSFFKNPALLNIIQQVKENKSSLHLIGLVSDGGVHSHLRHLYALLDLAKLQGLSKVYIHAVLDGRDVPPANAKEYLTDLKARTKALGIGEVATVSGRYYTMDRDRRWERIEKSYQAMVLGQGEVAASSLHAVEKAYENGQTDEFVLPTVVLNEQGVPRGLIREKDGVIFFNFRPDRARQITRALVDDKFPHFNRGEAPPRVNFVCFTLYDITIDTPVAFPPDNLTLTLGEVLSWEGLSQLRIAETEKYAHITFFFNGGLEEPYPGENRILIPSSKVATYNLKPEMSAYEVTEAVLEKIEENIYDVIVINFANPDMVGHTGILKAAIEAVEVVDCCVGRVVEAVLNRGGVVLLTSDHGNSEKMIDLQTRQPHTAHTSNRVPFFLIGDNFNIQLRGEGILADIAPTILEILNIEKPREMTGQSLIAQK
ncbi:2,3-bisphosphoglycerate-independent phosphoglycerate mutase [Candidatus Contubernalis alkaliaceticus]|uniref:2,3-bisphosphoglycerate-independent phosphoglycerate mutase n=1 Tax=Candidatus Contubernalis alkaliaceticus TaxID=338645 RepID=UPI001F4BD43E|nr:2,3-bisphosphoglycerate-independent phosphoglycerate mutase [Candidatus Contubernalis alkalaceticus]UNC90793.1 2,3-bisphosphoglycerate-independent phosphoglycerate mutase [Candidatus Contubernalis alkalaceticus]